VASRSMLAGWSAYNLREGGSHGLGIFAYPHYPVCAASVFPITRPDGVESASGLAMHWLPARLCVSHQNNSWLGEPHSVTRCLDGVPTVIVGNVTFNVLYNTMFSLFYSQACQMDLCWSGCWFLPRRSALAGR